MYKIEMKKKEEKRNGMIGAIVGDIVGSRFEWHTRKSKQFTLFRGNGRTGSMVFSDTIGAICGAVGAAG